MRRRLVPLLLAVLATAPLAGAQDLAARLERLVALVELGQREAQVPGLALGVIVDGQVVLARGLGTADLSSGATVTADTVFAIGSATKSFTAVLAGMLADEGRLTLDDTVASHVPGAVLAGSIEPTLQECLSHVTGLARMSLLSGKPDISFDVLLEHVRRAELALPYRTGFNYSNINFALVGEALARVAGSSWDTLVHERVFGPLGMTRSGTTQAERDALDDVAVGYEALDDDAPAGEREPAMAWDLAPIAAAGAINASLTDMLAWTGCLLAGGEHDGERLIERDTLEALWTPQVPLGPGMGYASGFFVAERDGQRSVYHGGNVPGFASQVLLFPDQGVGVVLLTNVMVNPLQDGIVDLARQCLLADTLPALPGDEPEPSYPDGLERLAGAYWFSQGDMAMTAQVADGKLALDVPGQTVYELLPPDADGKWFFALTDTIAVSFDQQGDAPASTMTLYQSGMQFVMSRYERAPVEGLPSVAELLVRQGAGSAAGGVTLAPGKAVIAVGEVRFPQQGAVGEYSLFSDGERRLLEVSDFGDLGEQRTVVDGGRGWVVQPSGWVESLGAEQLDSMLRGLAGLVAGDWSLFYDELEVVGSEPDGEATLYLLEGRNARGARDALRVSADGRLLSMVIRVPIEGLGSLQVTTTFSDWRDVGGVAMAHAAVSDMGALGRVEYQLANISRTARLDPSWFTAPAGARAAAVPGATAPEPAGR